MYNKKTVRVIMPNSRLKTERVVIYARVSSKSAEQLNSLSAQVSFLTKKVYGHLGWQLFDIYIDFCSGKTGSTRPEFLRLLEDCEQHKIDIIYTRTVSRFGRDTVDVIDALNKLKSLGVRVIFDQEDIDTDRTDSTIMVTIIEAVAQAENESRSENIKMGFRMAAESGKSKLYNRKCYGYINDSDEKLLVNEDEAENVKLIFEWYLKGKSILGIQKELEKRKINSPTGKEKWCKRSIDVMLSNEKYIGNVQVLKRRGPRSTQYLVTENHPAIISEAMFKAVQMTKGKRTNIVKNKDGSKRKETKYSARRKY